MNNLSLTQNEIIDLMNYLANSWVFWLVIIILFFWILFVLIRRQIFKTVPDGPNWYPIKSSNRGYKAYVVHEVEGRGKPIILLPGWFNDARMWRDKGKDGLSFIDRLKNLGKDYDIWMVSFSAKLLGDLRKYSRVELAEAIEKIMVDRMARALPNEKAILIGYSTGGVVGIYFTKDRKTMELASDHVETVIMMASPHKGMDILEKLFKPMWINQILRYLQLKPIIGPIVRLLGKILHYIFLALLSLLGWILLDSKSARQLHPLNNFIRELNTPPVLPNGFWWINAWGTEDQIAGDNAAFHRNEVANLDSFPDIPDSQFLMEVRSNNGVFRQKAFPTDHTNWYIPDEIEEILGISRREPRPMLSDEEVFNWIFSEIH